MEVRFAALISLERQRVAVHVVFGLVPFARAYALLCCVCARVLLSVYVYEFAIFRAFARAFGAVL